MPSGSERAHSGYGRYKWRPVDIAVASVIGVASGLVFWACDLIVTGPYVFLNSLLPGMAGLLSGFWYFAGVLAMLIVRKPGAALYAEVVAAALELTLGNEWGAGGSLVAGICQGILTEIAFLLIMYRIWNVWVASLAGAFAAIGGLAYSFVAMYAGMDVTGAFIVANVASNLVSGALVSGALMWLLYRAIARTGALDSFASGREMRGFHDGLDVDDSDDDGGDGRGGRADAVR